MPEPRAFTAEEVRQEFLDEIRGLAAYWETCPSLGGLKGRLEGLAFSILNIFDGTSNFPAVDLVLKPHPDDKEFHRAEGEDWYEPGMMFNDCHLHEMFYRKGD